MEQEIATLILNTFDIDPTVTVGQYYNTTVDNQYGIIENYRCTLTWKNINMRRVLGEMYDKYENFNIYLYQINQTAAYSIASPSSSAYLLVDVRIKGLQFLNNTYNVVSRNNVNTAYLTSYLLNNNGAAAVGTVTPLFNPTILTFSKNTECVDITIDMKCTRDQQYPTMLSNTAFGTFIFMFKIYGSFIREKNIIINGSRMNLN